MSKELVNVDPSVIVVVVCFGVVVLVVVCVVVDLIVVVDCNGCKYEVKVSSSDIFIGAVEVLVLILRNNGFLIYVFTCIMV